MDNQINVEDLANRRDLFVKSHIKNEEVCLKMLNKSLSYYLKIKNKQESTWQMVQSNMLARTPSQRIKFSVLCEEVYFYRELLDILFEKIVLKHQKSNIFDKNGIEVQSGDTIEIYQPDGKWYGKVKLESGCLKCISDNTISVCVGSYNSSDIRIIS